MKCFGCGAEGHLIRSCPEGAGGRRAAAAAGEGFVAPAPGGGPPAPGPALASGDPSACSGGEVSVETEANTKLEAQLTPQELYAALMSLKSGKAPGIDGLPVDFYKSFWSVLGEDLLEVFNNCLERGRLPLSCRRAVITLLPKKGDLQELKNWRPVALGPSEHPVSAKGGGWTGSGPSSQQGRCLSAFSSYRDSSPDLQTWFGGVYPAASLQRNLYCFGGFLDCPSWSGPTLSRLLRAAGVSTLGQVVELAGPRLDDPVGLAAQLGLRSTRVMEY
ncbi:hypothetical protein L3Q82_006654 [Scortum barcoo]|uniref:Uncharacterized protein n=1 Tax=Scortum barcoo TaxID=214431 RepID=A0ACB8X039_9TELE|nr:hypothetical protein L3Q82_006654 [Scortum barcoo]